MSKAEKAPRPTHSAKRGKKEETPSIDTRAVSAYQQTLFVNLALNMSWQLAIVVVVPILVGYELDQHWHTSPWLTVVGVLIAALGFVWVMIKVVRIASVRSKETPGDNK